MTLVPFTPDALDALALELLDLASTVRGMANSCRQNDMPDFELHGQKIHEWMGKLQDWTHDGSAKLETAIIRQRGSRRAQAAVVPASEPVPARRGSGRKKR